MADPHLALQQGSPEGCTIASFEGWELEQFILDALAQPQPNNSLHEYGHPERLNLSDETSVILELMDCDFTEGICQVCTFSSMEDGLERVGSQEMLRSLMKQEVEEDVQQVYNQLIKEEVDVTLHKEEDAERAVERFGLGTLLCTDIAEEGISSTRSSSQLVLDLRDISHAEFKGSARFPKDMSRVGMPATFSAAHDIMAAGKKTKDTTGGSLSEEDDAMLQIVDPSDQQSDRGSGSEDVDSTMDLKLLHLLLACAETIAEGNLEVAEVILRRLQDLSWEQGSPLQRLAVYMSEALAARLSPSASMAFYRKLRAPLVQSEVLGAFCIFYNVSPIGKFCHLTVNELILDAMVGDDRELGPVHIIDLHVGYGTQWAAFLHAVGATAAAAAGRAGGNREPPRVRLTAVGPCAEALARTGKKLEETARGVGVPFEYRALAVGSLRGFRGGMVEAGRDGEACVVSSIGQLHTMVGSDDDDGAVERLLREVRAAAGRAGAVRLLVAENDADHSSPLFLRRFVGCLSYYSAVFESLDAPLPRSSQARLKVERLFAGRKIGGILAFDGPPISVRHRTMRSWILRLGRAGFRLAPLPPAASHQARLLLHLYFPNTRFNLGDDHGADLITLRWNDTPLMAVASFHT